MSPAAHSLDHALQTDRAATLAALYQRAFPLVRRYVRRHGGADAEDVFQDAFVLVFEKAVAGTLTLTGPPGHYLFGVSRHLWQRELTRRRRLPTEALTPGLDAIAAWRCRAAHWSERTRRAGPAHLTQWARRPDRMREPSLPPHCLTQQADVLLAAGGKLIGG